MLSHRWRCLWTLLPRLNFVLLKNTKIIDNILFFHSTELESLKILFCVSQCEMSWKKWLMCASLKRVKQITLKIKPYMNVPPSLFSCDCLTVLKLVGFDLPRLPLNYILITIKIIYSLPYESYRKFIGKLQKFTGKSKHIKKRDKN